MSINIIGTTLDATVVAVNTATDTEITYARPIKSFIMRTRSQNQFQWRASSAAVPFFTFDTAEIFESKVLLSTNYQSASLGFVRSVGSDDTIEVIVSY